MVSKSVNAKFVAALAVFAMMFAGFGAIFFAQADDATVVDDETTITVTNVDKDVIVTIDLAATGAYADLEDIVAAYDGASIVVKGIYKGVYYDADAVIPAYLNPYITVEGRATNATLTITADYASFPGIQSSITGLKSDATHYVFSSKADFTEQLGDVTPAALASYEVSYDCAITFIVEDAIVGLYNEEEVQAAVDLAVAIVEEAYEGYLSPEEVTAAVEKAIADTKALYKDYKSPEEVKAAIDEAIKEYEESHPAVVKKDDTFLYVAIVFIAISIALALLFLYINVLKPKFAKNKEPKVI